MRHPWVTRTPWRDRPSHRDTFPAATGVRVGPLFTDAAADCGIGVHLVLVMSRSRLNAADTTFHPRRSAMMSTAARRTATGGVVWMIL